MLNSLSATNMEHLVYSQSLRLYVVSRLSNLKPKLFWSETLRHRFDFRRSLLSHRSSSNSRGIVGGEYHHCVFGPYNFARFWPKVKSFLNFLKLTPCLEQHKTRTGLNTEFSRKRAIATWLKDLTVRS